MTNSLAMLFKIFLYGLIAFNFVHKLDATTQYSASVSSDLSVPTYGVQGPVSSGIHYNQQDGLALKGQLGDILGPPIKIANGIGDIITGSALSGLGTGINSGSTIIGSDTGLLQQLGQAEMIKGGALYGGAVGKTAGATILGGLPGGIFSSVVNAPIKLVAVKDLKVGKELVSKGRKESDLANRYHLKAQNLMQTGDSLKYNGINQVISGATEGLTGVGNAVQKTANTAAAGLNFIPILFEIPDSTLAAANPKGARNLDGGAFINSVNTILPGLNEGLGGLKQQDGNRPAILSSNNPFSNLFGPTSQLLSSLFGGNVMPSQSNYQQTQQAQQQSPPQQEQQQEQRPQSPQMQEPQLQSRQPESSQPQSPQPQSPQPEPSQPQSPQPQLPQPQSSQLQSPQSQPAQMQEQQSQQPQMFAAAP